MEVRHLAEPILPLAEGRLGVPDDVLENLVDSFTAHTELCAVCVVGTRAVVLDPQSVVTLGGLHLLGRLEEGLKV